MALAPSTITAYRSGIASFTTFCRQTSLPPFPSSEIVLQFYVTSLARTVSYQTIKVYLASIQYYNIVLGHHISITAMDRLFYLLRGIRRSLGDSRTRIPRQPITLPQLRRLVHFIQYTYTIHTTAQCLLVQSPLPSLGCFGFPNTHRQREHRMIQPTPCCIQTFS